jgi:hypothetical protein
VSTRSQPRPKHPFADAARKPPTQAHRPAIWENMLGTVYAMNDAGEIKYFDFDWDGAREFAGVTPEGDPRIHREKLRIRPSGSSDTTISPKQFVLYIRRAA